MVARLALSSVYVLVLVMALISSLAQVANAGEKAKP